jgi:hypothetical protein
MAQNQKKNPKVDKELAYIQGVAKNLVQRLYGPDGLPWGTKLTELEDTVAAVRQALTEAMLQQALARQAQQPQRPPDYDRCPDCGRPLPTGDLTEPRQLQTKVGMAAWAEPKTRCQKCRRDFFPSESQLGD